MCRCNIKSTSLIEDMSNNIRFNFLQNKRNKITKKKDSKLYNDIENLYSY